MNPNNNKNNHPISPKLSSFADALKLRQRNQGFNSPDRPSIFSPFSELSKTKEIKDKRIREFHQARNKEWAGVYSAKQKQMEKRIFEIRARLQKLIETVSKFEFTVNQSLASEIPEPGIYHVSLLEHIQRMIELIQKNVNETTSWLSLYNARSKKMGFYKGQVKKQGTAFSLSQERQITTSIG